MRAGRADGHSLHRPRRTRPVRNCGSDTRHVKPLALCLIPPIPPIPPMYPLTEFRHAADHHARWRSAVQRPAAASIHRHRRRRRRLVCRSLWLPVCCGLLGRSGRHHLSHAHIGVRSQSCCALPFPSGLSSRSPSSFSFSFASVCHRSPKGGSALTFTWTPPAAGSGSVIFKATLVSSYSSYNTISSSTVTENLSTFSLPPRARVHAQFIHRPTLCISCVSLPILPPLLAPALLAPSFFQASTRRPPCSSRPSRRRALPSPTRRPRPPASRPMRSRSRRSARASLRRSPRPVRAPVPPPSARSRPALPMRCACRPPRRPRRRPRRPQARV
jgi:hypothetical protein